MRKFWTIYLLLNVGLVQAQTISEKCIVDENGDAIPFVNIMVCSGEGLISDANGQYILNTKINKDSIILFSHIAFHPLKIKAKSIPDTIRMRAKEHELKEVEISKLNIHKLLTQTFSKKKYVSKGNYRSIRSIGIGDSLVYFNEEQLKLTKINVHEKSVKRKGYGKISYNVDALNTYEINFSIGSTFLRNPHEFYKIKENLTKLISISKLVKQYPDYYQLEAVMDSVKITMYIDKTNSSLMRFEKIIMHDNKAGNDVAYCYNFKLLGKDIIVESLKYKTVLKAATPQDNTYDVYLFDILIDDVKRIESKHFNNLSDLKSFKQQSQVMDKEFLRYFKDNGMTENKKIVNSDLLKHLGSIKLPALNITNNTKLSYKHNYKAIFNESTNRYDFYSSDSKINFNIYSPQVANQHFYPIKKDSFNPYGVNDSKKSIVVGAVNSFLQFFQK